MRARDYQLIVFDWDGTLMDSAAKIVRCFQAALADVGIAAPAETAIRDIIGLGLKEAVAALLPDLHAATRGRIVERYREHFLHLDQTEMPLFAGVREGLADLNARGYLLAIATGKARRGLTRALHASGIEHLFVASRCADEAFSKPHPQMLLDILERTGMDAAGALMVGDTVYDLQMASSARVDAVAVSYGVHARDRLLTHAPLACLGSFSEVHAWLN